MRDEIGGIAFHDESYDVEQPVLDVGDVPDGRLEEDPHFDGMGLATLVVRVVEFEDEEFDDFPNFLELGEVMRVDEVEGLEEHAVGFLCLVIGFDERYDFWVPEECHDELVKQFGAGDELLGDEETVYHIEIDGEGCLRNELAEYIKEVGGFHGFLCEWATLTEVDIDQIVGGSPVLMKSEEVEGRQDDIHSPYVSHFAIIICLKVASSIESILDVAIVDLVIGSPYGTQEKHQFGHLLLQNLRKRIQLTLI